mgnify:CR=1 FL=1
MQQIFFFFSMTKEFLTERIIELKKIKISFYIIQIKRKNKNLGTLRTLYPYKH